jgi:hypothetical protein
LTKGEIKYAPDVAGFEEATALHKRNDGEHLGTDTSGEGDVPRFDRDAE